MTQATMTSAGHVACRRENKHCIQHEGKRPRATPWLRWENNNMWTLICSVFHALFSSNQYTTPTTTHSLNSGLERAILLSYSPTHKHQTILTLPICNNYPFLAYISYYLNNLTKIIQFQLLSSDDGTVNHNCIFVIRTSP
jgi:hypothetical protein